MAYQPLLHGLFTSESVCAGHPDKVCDQISDAILDAVLAADPDGHVAVETLVTKNQIILAGEIRSHASINARDISKQQIHRLGYTLQELNFTPQSPVKVFIHEQSPEIAKGVDRDGAGDQGMMYGYATKETATLMPLGIMLAHRLAEQIDHVRESRLLSYLRPDGKTQVTVRYDRGIPVSIDNVIIAVPHSPTVDLNQVTQDVYMYVVLPILKEYGFKLPISKLVVNGTGVWHFSGPAADTGVTGRKIIVDSYGSYARVGGGAFSGKDPTKVDRSGAYYARFIAKNLVAHGLMSTAEVRLAYAIGARQPISLEVEDFGTLAVSQKALTSFLNKIAGKSVTEIIEYFNLRFIKYLPTAAYGHFGRENFPWEKIVSLN